MSKPLALVADDNAEMRGMLVDVLEGLGYGVVSARSAEIAEINLTDGRPWVLVVLDNSMPPGLLGVELLRMIRSEGYEGSAVLCSGGDLVDEAHELRALFLAKGSPDLLKRLKDFARRVLEVLGAAS